MTDVQLDLPHGQSVLSDLARDIRQLIDVARGSIIEIGQKLIAAKAEVKHGEWLPWLDREFGWTVRTADRYMQVANAFALKLDSVSNFSGLTIDASALYALASPKVPEEVRDQAIEAASSGTRVTQRVARRLIEAATPAPAEDTDTDTVGTTEVAETDAIDTTEDDNGPIGATEHDDDLISTTEDDDLIEDDPIADRIFNRPPIPNDEHWQEHMRDWIDDQRDDSILLKDVIDRFTDSIPLYDATRRWYFDFEELADTAFVMRKYALLISLRSLGVRFSPPLGRDLEPTSRETVFTVPPRRRWR